jgi:type IV pilus assembly protein PilN
MKITLNLASRPFTDLTEVFKGLRKAMAVLALVAVALGLVLYYVQRGEKRAFDRAHLLDGDVAAMAKERQGYETMMQQPANAKVLAQTDALNDLFDEKAFSWTLVMKDLETVLPGPVQITTIEPVRTKDGNVILHLRVQGPRVETIRLVENMEHSDRFRLPRIMNESPESDAGSSGKLVSAGNAEDLDLLTDYNLARPVEAAPAAAPAPATAPKLATAPKPASAPKPGPKAKSSAGTRVGGAK